MARAYITTDDLASLRDGTDDDLEAIRTEDIRDCVGDLEAPRG